VVLLDQDHQLRHPAARLAHRLQEPGMACGAVDRGLDIQMPGRHCHQSVQALEGLLQVRGSERIVAVGSQADMGERIVRIAPAALQHCLPGQPADEQPYQGQAARQEQEQITQGLQPGAMDRVQGRPFEGRARWDGLQRQPLCLRWRRGLNVRGRRRRGLLVRGRR